ncbi:MAG: enoyl-CoA hydratase/isomerase family protein [Pseudomonadota bacterium]
MNAVLTIENEGPVRIITLNRPHRMNAFDLELACTLRDAVRAASADASVGALVLSGEGKHFSTGADLKRDRSKEQEASVDIVEVMQELFLSLRYGKKPAVAAVSGYAFGAGLSLALACDFVVADMSTQLSAPFTGVGLVPDMGLVLTLPERVGISVARDMLLMGTVKRAVEAQAIGLVDDLCEDGQSRARAIDKAVALTRRAPLAMSATRSMLAREHGSVEALLQEELRLQQWLRTTGDAREAAAAFAEKRQPVFQGLP